jgi:hypothetical protein
MSAFQFPDPASEQTVTNPSTGSTYEWKADPGKWVLVTSAGEIPDFPEQVTYQIQTDKILRNSQPAIELVDTAGYYSNVKFTGTGGIEVTSDFNGIIIDGSSIGGGNVNLDGYYTKTETDQLDAAIQSEVTGNKSAISALQKSKVTQYKYKIKSVESGLASRDGEIIVNSLDAKLITLISLAPSDVNGAKTKPIMIGDIIEFDYNDSVVRYIAESADTNVLMVNYVSGSRTMITNDSLYITIYPQNTANLLPSDVDANDYFTKTEVTTTIEAIRTGLQQSIDNTRDLIIPPGQNNPETYYGDYAPTGSLLNGDLWFDAMNLRLNVYSQGAWINPDRNDGADLENRMSVLEARIAQLEGN